VQTASTLVLLLLRCAQCYLRCWPAGCIYKR